MIILLGCIVGLSSSLLGIGGGILVVPLLGFFAASQYGILSQHTIVATSLANAWVVTVVNTYFFSRRRQVRWGCALFMGSLTALGALIAGVTAQFVDGIWLKVVFTLVLVAFTLKMILGTLYSSSFLKEKVENNEREVEFGKDKKRKAGFLAFFAGFLSGMSGGGSGMILSPSLIRFRLVRPLEVVPTSNAIVMFTTFFALIGYLWRGGLCLTCEPAYWGKVYLGIVAQMAPAAIFSAFWGRRYQEKFPEVVRFWGLMVLLIALSVKMAVGTLRSL
ncbi:MAG: sulfite exporter TauE/SafE family protein [Bdellovibrio sp.]|nr:MAG: sulfite exporter TauE/SafE family protein [Bdellovibrio sp.]